jgi:hypothetical protein
MDARCGGIPHYWGHPRGGHHLMARQEPKMMILVIAYVLGTFLTNSVMEVIG